MAKDFIGLIVGTQSGEIKAVINPDDDRELNNPRWLLLKGGQSEPMTMIKVPRGEYMGALSMEDIAAIINKHK